MHGPYRGVPAFHIQVRANLLPSFSTISSALELYVLTVLNDGQFLPLYILLPHIPCLVLFKFREFKQCLLHEAFHSASSRVFCATSAFT